MSRLYPVMLQLEGKKCVVVGGGGVAARKIESLHEAGADVLVVSPEVSEKARELVDGKKARLREGAFVPEDLEGAFLVIAATDSEEVNRNVAEECSKKGILANVADRPELCGFYVPSMVRRGDLLIAISTSGKSPAVARKVRQRLQEEFGPVWETFLDMMGQAREEMIARVDGQKAREERFRELAESGMLELVKEGRLDKAREMMEGIIGK